MVEFINFARCFCTVKSTLFVFIYDNQVCTNLGGRLSRLLFETLQQLLAVSYFNLLLLKLNQN